MFSKLLKHEWKQNAGLLGLLSLCALGVGLLGGLVLRGILYMSEQVEQSEYAALGVMSLSSAMIFLGVALVAYAFAVQFVNLFRFYKNKFTDEGYLTFTLPVSTRQIFLSSFLVMLAWLVLSGVVLAAAVALIALVGAGEYLAEYGREIWDVIKSLFWMADILREEPGYVTYVVLTLLTACVTPLYSLVLMMTSITAGSVLAKKHKILAAIGSYYCITVAVNTVSSVLTVLPNIFLIGSLTENPMPYLNLPLAVGLVLQIGLTIGGFFMSTYLMKRKLNLP